MLDTNDRAIAVGDRVTIVGNRRKSKETVAMNKWILSACFLVLAAAPVAASDVRLDSYRNPKNETFRNFNQYT